MDTEHSSGRPSCTRHNGHISSENHLHSVLQVDAADVTAFLDCGNESAVPVKGRQPFRPEAHAAPVTADPTPSVSEKDEMISSHADIPAGTPCKGYTLP